MAGMKVTVTGVPATVQAIKAFDPVMYRRMLAAARASVAPIMAEAAADSPIRTGEMAGAWTIRKMRSNGRNNRAFGYVVLNKTRQGSILEFAGSRSSGHTPQGRSLIASLTRTYGEPGRFAWAAYDRRHAATDAAFMGAIAAAEAEMNTRLAAL